ncbi:MAG: penicillin acylase family protein [Deltaproteobacteria bacterium]|nr:penicillin acylase family protein [Deltaproteobacteria bacterium]
MKCDVRHPETAELGKILEKWDFRERADQAAPVIFHKIYERFALEVFRDELGEELARRVAIRRVLRSKRR